MVRISLFSAFVFASLLWIRKRRRGLSWACAASEWLMQSLLHLSAEEVERKGIRSRQGEEELEGAGLHFVKSP
jgi:hypothetical protein